MRTCPKCGKEVDIIENVCQNCGADLPAPYDNMLAAQEVSGEESDDMVNVLPAGAGAELLASLGMGAEQKASSDLRPDELTILSGADRLLRGNGAGPRLRSSWHAGAFSPWSMARCLTCTTARIFTICPA